MKSIDVMGVEYTIIEYSELIPDDCLGLCFPETKEIHLHKSIRDRDTMIHEIVHAIFFEGGLCQGISREMTEVVCQQVAQVIHKNFRISFRD